MTFIKGLLHSYLNVGLNQHNDPEINRKTFMVNLFGLLGVLLTSIMGTVAWFSGNYILCIALYLTGISYLVSYQLQKLTGNKQIYSSIILFSMFGFLIYLVYSGGVANTGPLWIFMAAPVALFFDGLKRGLIDIAIFIGIISFMMFYPNDFLLSTHYSSEFKQRLLYSFLSVTFLSAYYEYSRQRSFDFMLKISQKFEQMAKFDPLTHLPNRRDAMDKLEYEHRRIERNLTPVAIILCDIDFFKKVNDLHGHAGGDKILVDLANLFKRIIRKQDTVSRWGGEEFLFVLPQTNSTQALVVANKIRNNLAKTQFEYEKQSIDLTVSMGISEVNAKITIEEAIKQADEFLYQAKKNGRNQFQPQPVVYQTEVVSNSEDPSNKKRSYTA